MPVLFCKKCDSGKDFTFNQFQGLPVMKCVTCEFMFDLTETTIDACSLESLALELKKKLKRVQKTARFMRSMANLNRSDDDE